MKTLTAPAGNRSLVWKGPLAFAQGRIMLPVLRARFSVLSNRS